MAGDVMASGYTSVSGAGPAGPEAAAIRATRERDSAVAHMEWALVRADEADAERAGIEAALAASQASQAQALAERDAVIGSTIWRASWPLRWVGATMPTTVRHTLGHFLRTTYWLVTFQFSPLFAAWRAARSRTAIPPSPAQRTGAESPTESPYDRWVRECDTLTDADRAAIRRDVDRLVHRPLISVVMTACETPEPLLRGTIASVLGQLYPHWELCIAGNASSSGTLVQALREAADDRRIKWIREPGKTRVGVARNAALALASGDFVALVDQGDLLPEHCLYEVAVELNRHPDADLIYTDEDQVESDDRRVNPYFKPDWNLDLLLSHDVFNHLGVFRRSLLGQIGGFREGAMDGAEDYDLVLRSVAATDPTRIRHIPAVLYHRRRSRAASSFSRAQLIARSAAARLAIADYLKGRGVEGTEVRRAPATPAWNRIRWPLPDPPPRVSLIVPTRDKPELLTRCAAGVLYRTDYLDLELLIVDNDSRDPEALALLTRLKNDRRVRVLSFPGPFNYAALNNAAVLEATGEIIVLLNSDIDVIDGGWLREMVSLAVRPDVGAVGAKLRFADDRIQHAGVVLGVGDAAIASHFGYLARANDGGHFGQLVLTREVSAVTGACLALRKAVFDAVGGLDAEHLPVLYNDVDFCLRIRERGWRVIWTPFAELYHLESGSRGLDQTPDQLARAMREAEYMRNRWGSVLDSDPFYNPNFDRSDHNFKLAIPSRREKPWRQGRI
jgi:glycosyltransferase involved in cell wall biosynthesis